MLSRATATQRARSARYSTTCASRSAARGSKRTARRSGCSKHGGGRSMAKHESELIAHLAKQKEEAAQAQTVEAEQQEAFILRDMPEEVLDGWLGEVCRAHMRDFPLAFAWPALLAAASVLVDR